MPADKVLGRIGGSITLFAIMRQACRFGVNPVVEGKAHVICSHVKNDSCRCDTENCPLLSEYLLKVQRGASQD